MVVRSLLWLTFSAGGSVVMANSDSAPRTLQAQPQPGESMVGPAVAGQVDKALRHAIGLPDAAVALAAAKKTDAHAAAVAKHAAAEAKHAAATAALKQHQPGDSIIGHAAAATLDTAFRQLTGVGAEHKPAAPAKKSDMEARTLMKKTVSEVVRMQRSKMSNGSVGFRPSRKGMNSAVFARAEPSSPPTKKTFRPHLSDNRPQSGLKMNSEVAAAAVMRASTEVMAAGPLMPMELRSEGRSGSVVQAQNTSMKTAASRILNVVALDCCRCRCWGGCSAGDPPSMATVTACC